MGRILPSAAGFALAAGSAALLLSASSSSGPDVGYAGDPIEFKNCTACHDSNPLDRGNGEFSIIGAPSSWRPGWTYTFSVKIMDPGQDRWGFQLIADDGYGNALGHFKVVDPYTRLRTGNGRTYISQKMVGTFFGFLDGPISWTVSWESPPAGSGTVRFYAAGDAADNDRTPDGDFIYLAGTTSIEEGSGASNVSLIAQPHGVVLRAGETLSVPIRIRNHSPNPVDVQVASRVLLPWGNPWPPTGWLAGPEFVSIPASGSGESFFQHAIPPGSPLWTFSYEVVVASLSGTLLDTLSFSFLIRP